MIARTETVEKTIYVATDGKEFQNSEECVRHEAELVLNSFTGIPPYVCINELTTGELVIDDKVNIIANYFQIPSDSHMKVYKADIQSERDLYWLIAFCEACTGIKNWTKENFQVGEKYILCVKDVSTRMYFKEELHYAEYNKILAYYESLLDYIRGIF